MNTYVILRRSGWRSPEELEEAAGRSSKTGEDMSDDIKWIRSYVLEEGGGSAGTVCIYQASSPRRSASTATSPTCRSTRSSRGRHRDHPRGPAAGLRLRGDSAGPTSGSPRPAASPCGLWRGAASRACVARFAGSGAWRSGGGGPWYAARRAAARPVLETRAPRARGWHRSPPAHAAGGRRAASSPPGPRDEFARRRRSSEITTRPSQRRRHIWQRGSL